MNAPPNRVDVCICAYARREGLIGCLHSLAAQIDAPPFRVLIADNHAEPVVSAWLSDTVGLLPFPVDVLHAPRNNIAIARNALLAAADAEWLAFIDDDETATPDWLATLYAARGDADVVFGPALAAYPAAAPVWLVRGDFLSKRPALRHGKCDTGPTANVLLRRSVVGGTRFDVSLGRCGGEDTLFFAELHRRGARLGYCERAAVNEPADPARSTLSALTTRSYASGHASARLRRMRGQSGARIVTVAAAKFAASLLLVGLNLASAVGWRREVLRAALHAGEVARALGVATPELYGKIATD